MTVYDYIAESNPMEAKSICESYGYTVTNPKQMGRNLKSLVNNEGENALKSIMQLHPDKEILVEYFGMKAKKNKKETGCGCKDTTSKRLDTIEAFINAGGNSNNNSDRSEAKMLASNTNTIIFASALVLAVAIIFKNDK